MVALMRAVLGAGVERDPHPLGLAGPQPHGIVLGRPGLGEATEQADRGAVGRFGAVADAAATDGRARRPRRG